MYLSCVGGVCVCVAQTNERDGRAAQQGGGEPTGGEGSTNSLITEPCQSDSEGPRTRRGRGASPPEDSLSALTRRSAVYLIINNAKSQVKTAPMAAAKNMSKHLSLPVSTVQRKEKIVGFSLVSGSARRGRRVCNGPGRH